MYTTHTHIPTRTHKMYCVAKLDLRTASEPANCIPCNDLNFPKHGEFALVTTTWKLTPVPLVHLDMSDLH